MKIKKIVATCPAGLGNRIKCMVSMIKKSHEDKFLGYVYWPLNDACGCEFNELFKPSIFAQLDLKDIDKDAELNKSWKFIIKGKELDFQYHKLTQKDINEFLPYFKFIRPRQDIQNIVQSFVNKYNDSFNKGEVIGVHIRKGDYNVSFDGRQYISKEDKFITKIHDLLIINANYKFFLCTEDEETEERFRKIFGNAIIYFPKKFRGRDNTNSIKEALIDLLLLSKCNIILGTFLSTFTEVAWWFSNCKAQIYIIGAEDRKAVDKVLAQLPKKGESIFKKIYRRIKIWILEGI